MSRDLARAEELRLAERIAAEIDGRPLPSPPPPRAEKIDLRNVPSSMEQQAAAWRAKADR